MGHAWNRLDCWDCCDSVTTVKSSFKITMNAWITLFGIVSTGMIKLNSSTTCPREKIHTPHEHHRIRRLLDQQPWQKYLSGPGLGFHSSEVGLALSYVQYNLVIHKERLDHMGTEKISEGSGERAFLLPTWWSFSISHLAKHTQAAPHYDLAPAPSLSDVTKHHPLVAISWTVRFSSQ